MNSLRTTSMIMALLGATLTGSHAFAAEGRLLADTHVWVTGGDKLGKNYGTKKQLELAPGREVFLQFDLSTLPDDCIGENVKQARLLLTVDKVTTPGTFEIRNLDDAWEEFDVSGDSAPQIIATAGDPDSQTVESEDAGGVLSIDVSELVRQWVDGEDNNGFVLVPSDDSTLSVKLLSREAKDPGLRPRLEIELDTLGVEGEPGEEGPQGVVGQQGPPGAQGAQGPAGDNGPAGADGGTGSQGPAGSVTESATDGAIGSLPSTSGNWALVPSSSTTVAVAEGETLFVFSTAAFAVGSNNTMFDLDIGIRNSGVGSYSETDDYHSFTLQQNSRFTFPLFRRITGLAAGSYDVGMVYRTSTGSLTSTNWTSTVAFSAK